MYGNVHWWEIGWKQFETFFDSALGLPHVHTKSTLSPHFSKLRDAFGNKVVQVAPSRRQLSLKSVVKIAFSLNAYHL